MTHQMIGGRGQKAPYDSTHARIPEPLKAVVNRLADIYRQKVTEYDNPYSSELINECLESLSILSEVNEQEIVIKTIDQFVEIQKNEFGKRGSQKGKNFDTTSRSWDNFNKFKSMVETQPKSLKLE